MIVFDQLDNLFASLTNSTGIADDQLKVVVSWLVCVPLGLFQDCMKDRFLRNIFSLFFGLFLSYMCIKENMFITLVASLSTYILASMLQTKCIIPVGIFNFTILISLHIHRFIVDPMGWKMDGTTSLMLIICKLVYFATYVSDGRISKLPNLLEFLGYVYFYPSAIIGPCFNFNVYSDFIQRKEHYAHIPFVPKLISVFKHLGLALLYIIGFQFIYPLFPIENLHTPWFKESNIFFQLLVINVLGVLLRFKYFTAWKLAQAGMNASGITYNGGNSFNRIKTMGDMFELEPSPRFKTEMWNSSVQIWLKDCFYDKFFGKYGANKSLVLTFVVSAIWHGVHPIYYFGFIQWALMNDVTKFLFRARSKFTWLKGIPRTLVCWFIGNSAICYMGIGIALLDWDTAINFYKSMNFIPTIIQVVLYIFFLTTNWGIPSGKKNNDTPAIPQDPKKKQ